MIVPLVDGRVGTEEVEVSAVVHIPHMDALCALEHHRDGGVVVGAKLVLPINVLRMGKASTSGSNAGMSCHIITGKVFRPLHMGLTCAKASNIRAAGSVQVDA